MSATTAPAPSHRTSAKQGPGTVRKVSAILAILVGVVLIVITFTNNLFKVGPAFESMMNDFRPMIQQSSIDEAKANLSGLSSVATEVQGKMIPAVSAQLGMTAEQFSAMVNQQFPAVSAGLQAIPQAVPAFTDLMNTLETNRPLFESADAIPTKNMPASTVPWMLLISGLLSIGVGVLIWFTARAGAIVALVLGAALVVLPLVMSLPQKAADADQLNKNLQPVYTQQLIDQSKQTLTTLGAMGQQMQTKMLPALATQLKMSNEQLQAFLGQNFPATATALGGFDTTMTKFQNMVSAFETNLDNYNTLKSVKFVPIVWTMIGGGVVIFLLGGAALFAGRREPKAA
jgi:hypothetical protein